MTFGDFGYLVNVLAALLAISKNRLPFVLFVSFCSKVEAGRPPLQ
jgi:hypothetical protein